MQELPILRTVLVRWEGCIMSVHGGPSDSRTVSPMTLTDIHARILGCTDCALRATCQSPVPGQGSPTARVMYVGEGPGAQEDQQGLPFTGPSGQMLRSMSIEAGVDPGDTYFTNIVKCRPPNNRDPRPEEISTCLHYLDEQIETINPKVIVTVGRYAMVQFLPDDLITKVHGRPHIVNGRVVMPIIHTAAALRRPEWKPMIAQDLRLIPRILELADNPPTEGVLTIL